MLVAAVGKEMRVSARSQSGDMAKALLQLPMRGVENTVLRKIRMSSLMKPTGKSAESPPPKQSIYWQQALFWQSMGFLTIIVLTWCDAIFDLTHNIFGMQRQNEDINQTAISTAVIVLLWMLSGYKIYRVVSRLSYLESFLHVCAWCRKIEHDNQWFSIEEHFTKRTGGQTSHGICPECSAKLLGKPIVESHS